MLNLNSNASSSSSSSSLISFSILNRDEKITTHLSPEDSLRRINFPAVQNAAGNEWLNLSPCSSINCEYHEKAGIMQQNSVQKNQGVKKSRRGPRSRSSPYRGVTFYRRTGRWESHIWDCGKQIYLGGFDTAEAAARAYDKAAIRFRGLEADINFAASDYEEDIRKLKYLSKVEFVKVLRRKSTRGGNFSGWDPGEDQSLELSLGVSCCVSKKQERSGINKVKLKKPDATAGKASSTGCPERSWISQDNNTSNVTLDVAASSGFSSSSALISFMTTTANATATDTGLSRYDNSY